MENQDLSTTQVMSQALDLNAEQVAKAILLRNSLATIAAVVFGILAYRAGKGFWFILFVVIVGSIVGAAAGTLINSFRNYQTPE